MSEFRLTQISDTHLARRLQKLTDNFHRVSEHIDATRPDLVINPVKIAEAYYYLHTQDKSCWTHELQLTPYGSKPSY